MSISRNMPQLARQAYETKQAQGVSIIVMNVRNGEILAMTDVPEFDLNEPYTLIPEMTAQTGDEPLSFGTEAGASECNVEKWMHQ